MKYMTFNRSCSYATLANLLEEHGLHYEDYEIAKALSIPYLFHYRKDCDRYVAGPMIQGVPWYPYFLNSLGFDLVEQRCTPKEVLLKLDEGAHRYKLSLKINPIGVLSHAVLFEGKENNQYKFLNPKRKASKEPDYYVFTKEEVLEKLAPQVMMGHLVKIEQPIAFELSKEINASLDHLDNYQVRLNEFCSKEQDVETLLTARDELFAPLMLDVLSMMEMIEEVALAEEIKAVRAIYMTLIKENRPLRLADRLPLEQLNQIISKYRILIKSYKETDELNHFVCHHGDFNES